MFFGQVGDGRLVFMAPSPSLVGRASSGGIVLHLFSLLLCEFQTLATPLIGQSQRTQNKPRELFVLDRIPSSATFSVFVV